MSNQRSMDQCSDCEAWLPAEDPRPVGAEREPCATCGSTRRTKFGEMHVRVSVSVTADSKLIISWQEVDRLLAKSAFAAALLVAAVNVEFTLWENLRRFVPSLGQGTMPDKVSSAWGKILKNQSTKVSLSSLLSVTSYLTQNHSLALSPTWDPLVCEIDEVRNQIAHERGYFARLTQLKEPDWPETVIRRILENAKEFCHGNAP